MTRATDPAMDRRDALKRIGMLLGAAVSAPVASAVMAGCRAGGGQAAYAPQVLTPAQDELVATVAELIIPATDTPGARAAGVNVFVDRVLAGAYTEPERSRFLAGLADLDVRAQEGSGGSFLDLSSEEQAAVLRVLEAEASPFYAMMKELTLVGYYTSEAGATQELQYVHVAGRYDGDVPLAEAGRAYA
jgi:hypothetical protein